MTMSVDRILARTAHRPWPLPDRLPRLWGSGPRAKMAAALLSRHLVTLDGEPSLLVQGASGITPVSAPLERGACYVAVVAVTLPSAISSTLAPRSTAPV